MIAIAVVAVLAIAGIAWFAVGGAGTGDIDVATELVDRWSRGWVESDPDVVGSFFTDDAIYGDYVEVFAFSGGVDQGRDDAGRGEQRRCHHRIAACQ